MAQQAIEKVGPSKHNLARTGRMALYGGGNPSPLPLPSPALPLPFPNIPSPSQNAPANTHHPSSRLRPRSNNLVRLPRAPDQFPHKTEPDDRRARSNGPDRLRVQQPLLLPVVDGDNGGDGSGGEAAGHVLGGAQEELDGVAGGAGGEFPVRAVGASGAGGECC